MNTPEETASQVFEFMNNLETALGSTVKVGIQSSSIHTYEDGDTVTEVGAQNEFGVPGSIPRRSFLRMPFAVKKKELDKFIQKMFKKVAEEGLDAKTALGLIGTKAQQIVQDAFTTKGYGNWPENSPQTIEEKGSSQPLIDTGALRSSITYEVK